jgi:hypothetical protein
MTIILDEIVSIVFYLQYIQRCNDIFFTIFSDNCTNCICVTFYGNTFFKSELSSNTTQTQLKYNSNTNLFQEEIFGATYTNFCI